MGYVYTGAPLLARATDLSCRTRKADHARKAQGARKNPMRNMIWLYVDPWKIHIYGSQKWRFGLWKIILFSWGDFWVLCSVLGAYGIIEAQESQDSCDHSTFFVTEN